MNLKKWYESLFLEGQAATFSELFLCWNLSFAFVFLKVIEDLGFSAPWQYYAFPIGLWLIMPIARVLQRLATKEDTK